MYKKSFFVLLAISSVVYAGFHDDPISDWQDGVSAWEDKEKPAGAQVDEVVDKMKKGAEKLVSFFTRKPAPVEKIDISDLVLPPYVEPANTSVAEQAADVLEDVVEGVINSDMGETSFGELVENAAEQFGASQVLDNAETLLQDQAPIQVAESLKKVAATATTSGAHNAATVLQETAKGIEAANPQQAQEIVKQVSTATKNASANLLKQAEQKDPVRFAAMRTFFSNCWQSKPVTFVCDMCNPFVYGRACADMWNAGFRGALPVLWNEYKPVIAGTTIITSAAAVATYYAYKKGMLDKAKDWVVEKQKQCQKYFA